MSDSEQSIQRQIDSICNEFADCWRENQRPDFKAFLQRIGTQRQQLLESLLELDLELRLQAGQEIKFEEYQDLNEEAVAFVKKEYVKKFLNVPDRMAPTIEPRSESDSPDKQPNSDVAETKPIGPYKLLQQIGEGGMGTVWMAEQETPVQRRVALKIIKPGMDTEHVIARFEAERQALALMDHPNIAHVLDVGTTEAGRPYFVMELIKGLPITRFCDEKRLPLKERLQLFKCICGAVQHAHQKGIIHRDLKPSNILVAEYDNEPVPKIIDFGLAKALHQRLTEKTMYTHFGQILGTLEYMSPEQSRMNQLDVDTRSDIYSLGVVLYELLTGTTPFEKKRLQAVALDQVLKIIREEDPPKPSTRLSTVESKPEIAARRGTDPNKLNGLVRGELDWIVLKALEKDRGRRYATANALADDVTCLLNNEAVAACPPSATYRFRKFARRHRSAVVTATFLVSILTLGMLGTGLQAIRAMRAEKKARAEQQNAEFESLRASEEARKATAAADRAHIERLEAVRQKQIALTAQQQSHAAFARTSFFLATARWNEHRVSEALEALHRVPPEYRNIEWHLANRLFEGSDVTFYGHTDIVSNLDYSPDGTKIVSSSWDRSRRIWDVLSGEQVLSIPSSRLGNVAFSPKSEFIADDTRKSVRLWDASTGSLLDLHFPREERGLLSFEPAADYTLWRELGGALRFLPKGAARELESLPELDNVRQVHLGPHRRHIFLVTDRDSITLLNLATGKETTLLESGNGVFRDLDVAPDGRTIAIGYNDRVDVLDVATGTLQKQLFSDKGYVFERVKFSPDGSYVAVTSFESDLVTGRRSTIRIWEPSTGQVTAMLVGHAGRIRSVVFSSDGSRLASCSRDNTVKLWSVPDGRNSLSFKDHAEPVSGMAVDPTDTRTVSADASGRIVLRNRLTGVREDSWETGSAISQLRFLDDGNTLVATGQSGTVEFWDVGQHSRIRTVAGSGAAVVDFDITIDQEGGLLAALTKDHKVRLSRVRDGSEIHSWDNASSAVRLSLDGSLLATGIRRGEGAIGIWDTASGRQLHTLIGHSLPIRCISFSPEGKQLASGSLDGTARLWNESDGRLRKTLFGHIRDVYSVTFSQDGSRLLTAGADGTARIWDAESGEELLVLYHDDELRCATMSADGTRVLTGSVNGVVTIWQAFPHSEATWLRGHSGKVSTVAVSQDGRLLVSGSGDGTVRVWDIFRAQVVHTLRGNDPWLVGHTDFGTKVNFTPDGKSILSLTSEDGRRRGWDVVTGDPIEDVSKLDWAAFEQSSNVTPDGHWIATPIGNNIVLSNQFARQSVSDRSYRRIKARTNSDWHLREAEVLARRKRWYGAAFHYGWALKATPSDETIRSSLKKAILELEASNEKASPDDLIDLHFDGDIVPEIARGVLGQ